MKIEGFRDLQRLAHGFQMAKVFFTANDLDLFTHLGQGRNAGELAYTLGLDARALGLLLNALVALGVLEKDGDLYRNGATAAEFLVAGENYRGSIFKHVHHCWESWSALPQAIRDGAPELAREKDLLSGTEEQWTRDFIRGMDDVTRDLAPQVAAQLDLSGARRLIDVGGGPGTYAAAFLEAFPGLQEVVLFDLPGALKVGQEKLQARGLQDRVRLVCGDFYQNDLGEGFDAVWISQVFHSQTEEGCRLLIDKAWRALNPGGRVLVHEFLLDDTKTSPMTAALFAVHMLVMTEGGRSYSGSEISGWMTEKGFERPEVCSVSQDTAVVLGRKPC